MFSWCHIIRERSLQNNVACLVEVSVEFIEALFWFDVEFSSFRIINNYVLLLQRRRAETEQVQAENEIKVTKLVWIWLWNIYLKNTSYCTSWSTTTYLIIFRSTKEELKEISTSTLFNLFFYFLTFSVEELKFSWTCIACMFFLPIWPSATALPFGSLGMLNSS